jgi:hypothetical protein
VGLSFVTTDISVLYAEQTAKVQTWKLGERMPWLDVQFGFLASVELEPSKSMEFALAVLILLRGALVSSVWSSSEPILL